MPIVIDDTRCGIHRQLYYSDHIKKFSQHQYCSSQFPPFHSSGGETGHGFASHLSSSSGCPCCCWATQCRPHQAHHTWASRPCIHGRRNLKVDKSSYSNLDSTEIRMLILPILCRRMSTLPSPQSRPSTSFNTLTGVPFDLRLASTTSYPPLFQVGSSKGFLLIGALVKVWRKESSQRPLKIPLQMLIFQLLLGGASLLYKLL